MFMLGEGINEGGWAKGLRTTNSHTIGKFKNTRIEPSVFYHFALVPASLIFGGLSILLL